MRGELVVERIVDHPPQRVWEHLTSPAGAEAFFDATGFQPRVGHCFQARVPRGPGFDGQVRAEVLEVDVPSLLRMWWAGGPVAGEVRITVESAGDGTRVRLVQTGFDRDSQSALAPALMMLWGRRLDVLSGLGGGLAAGGAAAGLAGGTVAVLVGGVTAVVALLIALVGLWWSGGSPGAVASASPAPPGLEVHASADPPAARDEQGPIREVDGPTERATSDTPLGAGPPSSWLDVFETTPTTNLNPLFSRTDADRRTRELVFDRLFYRDAITNELRSRLVSRFQVLDGGAALRIWLREGMTWHDGEPVTAQDICFTVDTLRDPAVPATGARALRDRLRACAVESPLVARITLDRATWQPREVVSFHLLPAHRAEDVRAPESAFSRAPVGTGPFRARQGRRQTGLEAAPSVQHQPSIGGLRITEGGDPFVQVRTLVNKGVDGVIEVSPSLRPEVATSPDAGLKTYDVQQIWALVLDTGNPVLADPRVRAAIDATLDRKELARLSLGPDVQQGGAIERINGPFVPSDPLHSRILRRPVQDLDAAEALWEQAGAVKIAGRWHLDGKPVHLRMGLVASLDVRARDLHNQVANQLTAGGIGVEVYRVTDEDFARMPPTGGERFDLMLTAWTADPLHEDLDALFRTPGPDHGARNLFAFSDPTTDGLLEDLASATTESDARHLAYELQDRLRSQRPMLFLWSLTTISGWGQDVRSIRISPRTYWSEVDRWEVKRGP